jgi:hypothetical protein
MCSLVEDQLICGAFVIFHILSDPAFHHSFMIHPTMAATSLRNEAPRGQNDRRDSVASKGVM